MAPKQTWPGWENVGLLGKGGFGAVYEIQRDVFGTIEKAALKIVSIPKSSSDVEELRSDGYDMESIRQRYRDYLEEIVREYSLMATMKGNSNIVDCDDLSYEKSDDGVGWNIYIKMELLTPLTKALGEEITEKQVLDLARDICNALVVCRNRNIVHRDIKPQNIFVSADGRYKLGDFGIAKISEKTSGGTKTGTFRYMAPEVYNNQPYGFAVDIYSLGIVLYWMLNDRRTPFLPLPPKVPTAMEEEEAIRRRLSGEDLPYPKNGSEALKKIVCKACAADPEKRYKSADEMLADLELAAAGKDVVTEAKTVEKSAQDEAAYDATTRVSAMAEDGAAKAPEKKAVSEKKSEKSPADGKKKSPKLIIIAIIAAVIIIAGVAAAILLSGGGDDGDDGGDVITEQSTVGEKPDYPSERQMMSAVKEMLEDNGIDGMVTEIRVTQAEENEKYSTYTAKCSVTVKDGSDKTKYKAVLVYDLRDDEWVISSDLSRIED